MSEAILFHHMRGSGREVRISLGTIGVEIISVSGEPIAVWPYSAIERARVAMPIGLELRLGESQITTLQIHNDTVAKQILAKSPLARTSKLGRIINMVLPISPSANDQIQYGVVSLIVLIGYGIFSAWEWLVDSLQSLTGW